jgi:hypothetical protein
VIRSSIFEKLKWVLVYQHPLKQLNRGRNTITGSKIAVERFPIQSLMAPIKEIVMQEMT